MTALPDTPDHTPAATPLSRRRILGRLSAAAVGGAAIATSGLLDDSAEAATGDTLRAGWYRSATDITRLESYGCNGLYVRDAQADFVGIEGYGRVGVSGYSGYGTGGLRAGVIGECHPSVPDGFGVIGFGPWGGTGVRGTVPDQGYGVRGKAGSGFGVLGEATSGGYGVQGESDTAYGVRGVSTGGMGVRGESQTDVGVYGRSVNATGVTGYGGSYGVIGQCDPGGTAVDATSSDGGTGVWGRSLPTGYGVRGESSSGFGVRGEAVTGIGVAGSAPQGIALSGEGRFGGQFKGTRAAVRLVPTASVGPPTTAKHQRGELVCDNDGHLWFCTGDGTPGTWAQIV